MTQDDIIAMAREADIDAEAEGLLQALERFAASVAANERAACAKVCEELDKHFDYTIAVRQCAAAIRARGE